MQAEKTLEMERLKQVQRQKDSAWYVCVYMWVRGCVCLCVHVHMCVCVCMCTCSNPQSGISAAICRKSHTYACKRIRKPAYMCINCFACMQMCTWTYMHASTSMLYNSASDFNTCMLNDLLTPVHLHLHECLRQIHAYVHIHGLYAHISPCRIGSSSCFGVNKAWSCRTYIHAQANINMKISYIHVKLRPCLSTEKSQMWVCMHLCVNTYKCTTNEQYMCVYIYTHTHTYICTHMQYARGSG
jgi:hypothetical protein